jgi:hypothetical protein
MKRVVAAAGAVNKPHFYNEPRNLYRHKQEEMKHSSCRAFPPCAPARPSR